MDKNMNAKLEKILKAHPMRELSMDEMDKVSGGGDVLYDEDGRTYLICKKCGDKVHRYQYGGWAAFYCDNPNCDEYWWGG